LDQHERFWRGRSALAEGDAGASRPFAIVAAATGAGASSGAADAAVAPAPRPALGPEGGPGLAVPLALDASRLAEAPPKLWPALARAASATGCALVLSPDQLLARAELFRAARVATFLSVGPDSQATPGAARAAGGLLMRLASRGGAPAVLDGGALPGWVEACRALSGYQAPAAVSIPPGRRPPWRAIGEARAAGLAAVACEEGEGAAREPIAARVGRAAQAASAGGGVACLLGADEPPDGAELATLLAAGARTVVTPGPVEAALRHGGAFEGDWKALADALAHAVSTVWDDARRVARGAGCADPRDLGRDNLRALTYDAAALSGARLSGFDERLPWWVH